MFTFNTYGIEYIAPLLRARGKVFGIFGNYKFAQKSLYNFKNIHKNFLPEKMTYYKLKSDWKTSGVDITDEKSIGFTSKNEPDYNMDVTGETLEILGYIAQKK